MFQKVFDRNRSGGNQARTFEKLRASGIQSEPAAIPLFHAFLLLVLMLNASDRQLNLDSSSAAFSAPLARQTEIRQHIIQDKPTLERFSFEFHPRTTDKHAIYWKFLRQNARLVDQNFLTDQPEMPAHFLAKLFGLSRPSERPQHSRALSVRHANLHKDKFIVKKTATI